MSELSVPDYQNDDGVHGHGYNQGIKDCMPVVDQLQRKNDALVARVARLEQHLKRLAEPRSFDVPRIATQEEHMRMDYAEKALNETESESLAHIKILVIYEFKSWLISELGDEGIDPCDCDLIVSQSDFDDYAKQLRQQGKDHD